MNGISGYGPYRKTITRTVVAFCLLMLAWRGFGHILPHQLMSPPLVHSGYDLAYWLIRLSHLDQLLIQDQTGAYVFTILIFSSLGLLFLYPLNRLIAASAAALYFLYTVCFHLYLTHTLHYQAGMVLMLFAFTARKDSFDLWWETMRYFACFAFFTAFCWKLVYGSFFQWDFGVLSMKQNLAGYLLHYPDTGMAQLYYFFITNPWIPDLGHKLVVLAEGLFLVGFFTRRADRLLIGLQLFIFLSIYLFADVFFAELLVLVLPFLTNDTWKRFSFRRKAIHS